MTILPHTLLYTPVFTYWTTLLSLSLTPVTSLPHLPGLPTLVPHMTFFSLPPINYLTTSLFHTPVINPANLPCLPNLPLTHLPHTCRSSTPRIVTCGTSTSPPWRSGTQVCTSARCPPAPRYTCPYTSTCKVSHTYARTRGHRRRRRWRETDFDKHHRQRRGLRQTDLQTNTDKGKHRKIKILTTDKQTVNDLRAHNYPSATNIQTDRQT